MKCKREWRKQTKLWVEMKNTKLNKPQYPNVNVEHAKSPANTALAHPPPLPPLPSLSLSSVHFNDSIQTTTKYYDENENENHNIIYLICYHSVKIFSICYKFNVRHKQAIVQKVYVRERACSLSSVRTFQIECIHTKQEPPQKRKR